MTLSKDYRTRAAHVRRSARAHLKEIRRARLARKDADGIGDTMDDAPQFHEEIEDVMPVAEEAAHSPQIEEDMPSFDDDSTPPMEEPDAGPDSDAVEHAALADMFDEAPDMSDMQPDPPAEASAPSPDQKVELAAPSDDDAEDQGIAAVEDPSPLPEAELAEPASVETEVDFESSDLNTLPGAGPGLVWMLHQCGVRSLADLAASDPEVLTPKLGVVGQILDVNKWIDFASSEPPPAH